MTEKPFRFGVNLVVPSSRDEWVAKCRRAEELGYDVIGVADHLGMPAPFPALILAAEATERPRLTTYVLNAPFYNPTLLAREVTSTDQFTDGRLELGLGAGYVKAEFDEAGLPFPRAGERVDHLERTVLELQRRYADPEHRPQPTQKPGPPLLLAGRGDRLLSLAAEHADIIGFTGAAPGNEGGRPRFAAAEALDERVEFVRNRLGGREVEFNVIVFRVVITDNRAAALDEATAMFAGLTAAQLGEMPIVQFGTPEQVAEQIRVNRKRFGFTYLTVSESDLEAFAPVIGLLR
ncbi:MAG: cxm18 [Amycolatopsis sp.]|uniref:LLM class F420-dependent oxidoreductase n=1 Tax=Amycolatopsis sp. TaxID=37632 RepID=UPI00260CF5BD|nr:LLM class F420-dependent oxidoreductase [Amycolatopsis sp.]MCU1684604.1 cxm18 [Amycolatopsis sp.]